MGTSKTLRSPFLFPGDKEVMEDATETDPGEFITQ